ncbi:MAG: M23 family metallopeptidase [Magnetococcales bacterium]|nr:M23 family metallopeptidase [Magnetococcales bacterium]
MFRYALLIALLLPSLKGMAADLSLSAPPSIGTAVMLQVTEVPDGARLTGHFHGKPLPFTANHRALLALDMEAKPGSVLLQVELHLPQGPKEVLTKTFLVPPRTYREEPLTLPKTQVELEPETAARAAQETATITATYSRRGGRVGYEEGFQLPVTGRFSGVFGSRRILNGKPRKPHNGTDIAAPQGTPVVAIASGEVALRGEEYFFTGNTLVLDHGDGVLSLYAHLESMAVQPGEWVAAGTPIGTLGKTGRATGPHLHWSVMVRQDRVDPQLLPGILPATASAAALQ